MGWQWSGWKKVWSVEVGGVTWVVMRDGNPFIRGRMVDRYDEGNPFPIVSTTPIWLPERYTTLEEAMAV